MPEQMRTCFVVMPFGKKTDFQTGRVLDLDRTYAAIIKPAVEEAGLQCLRADEIMHSGVIDLPVFEQLLEADLVIADLSTLQANTIYVLGLRHALRPSGTILIAELQVKNPFDFSHMTPIRSYQHLEKTSASARPCACEPLAAIIKETVAETKADSPVYQILPDLQPPQRAGKYRSSPSPTPSAGQSPAAPPVVAALLNDAKTAVHHGDWMGARTLYGSSQKAAQSTPTFCISWCSRPTRAVSPTRRRRSKKRCRSCRSCRRRRRTIRRRSGCTVPSSSGCGTSPPSLPPPAGRGHSRLRTRLLPEERLL